MDTTSTTSIIYTRMLQPYSIHRELAEWSVWRKPDQVSIWSWKWNFPLSQQWWQYPLLAITTKTRYTMLKIIIKFVMKVWRCKVPLWEGILYFWHHRKDMECNFSLGRKKLNAILRIYSSIQNCNSEADFLLFIFNQK